MQLILDLLILFIQQVIATLDIFGKFITFNNWELEVYSTKLDNIIYLQIMQLVLGLKLFQNVIAWFLATKYKPHSFGKIYIVLEVYFFVELRLW